MAKSGRRPDVSVRLERQGATLEMNLVYRGGRGKHRLMRPLRLKGEQASVRQALYAAYEEVYANKLRLPTGEMT